MAHAPLLATYDVDAWWNSIVQTIWRRASHDVKDALNGVSVNVQVIQSRAARTDLSASALAPFGAAASNQVEKLATLLDALLALPRPERTPPDVVPMVRRLAVAVSASAKATDRSITVDTTGVDGATTVQVMPDVVRIALAGNLLGAVTSSAGAGRDCVECRISTEDAVVRVRLSNTGGAAHSAAEEEFLQQHGIVIQHEDDAITMSFPRA